MAILFNPAINGSSPRLWGTLEPTEYLAENNRFIPTAVGNAMQ